MSDWAYRLLVVGAAVVILIAAVVLSVTAISAVSR